METTNEMKTTDGEYLIERIKYLIKHLFDGNNSKFGREFDIPQATLKDIVGKKKNVPRFDTLKKILINENYPISSDWLMLNIGGFQKPLVEKSSEEMLKKIEDLEETIALQNRLIKMQDGELKRLMK